MKILAKIKITVIKNQNKRENMEIIDNKTKTLKEDLVNEIREGSIISIAAASFSIYAYDQLKEELENIDEFKFIFTSPTFIADNLKKESAEYDIFRRAREQELFGTEFEIKLRNEMTQKSIAKECADWIRRKAKFKSNTTHKNMPGLMNLDDISYYPINNFTTVDLGLEDGNNDYFFVNKLKMPESQNYYNQFESLWKDKEKLEDVTDLIIENISTVYKDNTPEYMYFVTLYNIFKEFLQDLSEDELPNESTGYKDSKVWNMLFNYQEDATVAIINKLEKYNGCILADSVGLGKTFTALAVIKYYENRNKSVLVLCPKKLKDNWNTYKANYLNNPLAQDRMRYDVLFHTDLSREKGESNGIELDRINWGNYDLVVIDESHNFRNGGKLVDSEKENRYLRLLNKVIRTGVKTKVLMLSATPVNNKFTDLKNQLALAYEGNNELLDNKLNTNKNINEIFKQSQKAFNSWTKLEAEDRTTQHLLDTLDSDFFELLDSVTIARSRKHIQKYYDTTKIGSFPIRNIPISKRPGLTDLEGAVTYNDIFDQLNNLNLCIYTPTDYILSSKLSKYTDQYDSSSKSGKLTQSGREKGIRRLMSINLMKRMESSVHAFKLTIDRILSTINSTIQEIENYEKTNKSSSIELEDFSDIDDEIDETEETFTIGKKVQIDIADMDYKSWKRELELDKEILELIAINVADITSDYDLKLKTLLQIIDEKQLHPLNPENKKILIFTAFADTAKYLYENVSKYVKDKYNLNTAIVTGSADSRTTIKNIGTDLNTVLTLFSPKSKDKNLIMPEQKEEIDILIATDCISEGQNLQDCDYLINYDIHWNPVRIIQRFGRIDRIGSKNKCVQLVNFWPDLTLDEYINLKARVETRMKIVDMTATGDDNVLSNEQKLDLEYRKKQLKKLQEEVVDIEEMDTGISIMDLGLNEYKFDLLDYIKNNPDIKKAPLGMNTIVQSQQDCPEGVIFVLKNRKDSINIDKKNRLHPFYIVYISQQKDIVIDHLQPKKLLDTLRLLCKNKTEIYPELINKYNIETNDSKNMTEYSELLEDAIKSIIEIKDENELDDFLLGKEVSFISQKIEGLDDFELISFFVIK